MPVQHKADSTVRAYLLGTLPPKDSAALEERYFVDPAFFEDVQRAEDAMLADYFAGRLSPEDLRRLEERYLHDPILNCKLESARAALPVSHGSRFRFARPAFAIAAMLGIAVAGIMLLVRSGDVTPSNPPLVAQHVQPPLELHLTPGIAKGPADRTSDITGPIPSSGVRLTLELPGVFTPVRYHIAVSRIGPDGQALRVWNSAEPVVSSAGAQKQQNLSFTLTRDVLPAGDYLVALSDLDGTTVDKYLLRVVTSN